MLDRPAKNPILIYKDVDMRVKIFVLGLIYLLVLSFTLPVFGDSWNTIFKGMGYEAMYLKMDDGKLLKFTTYHKDKIDRTDFFAFIKKKGYRVSQIEVCIHNHPVRHGTDGFSGNDKKFYQQICKHRFKGEFLLYRKGKIYNL